MPLFMQAEEILAKLVAFDTTSWNSNRACAEWIHDYLKGFGVESEIVLDESGEKACLWATVGQAGKPGVMLAGHTDVVPVEGQKWASDPFALNKREGKLYGRGAVDMKGFIACALAFVPEFLEAKTGGCFHLAFTCDEETSMVGAQRLASALKAKGVKPEWIWLGEPTGFRIIDEHKGCAAFVTELTGVSAHSSLPDKGLNAIEMMAEFIEIITKVQARRKQEAFSPSKFDVPYTTINPAIIKGGTAENIIAEKCELLWQVRVYPNESAEDVRAEVEALAAQRFAQRFTAFAPKAKMATSKTFDIPPFQGRDGNRGTEALRKVVKDVRVVAAGFATEAGFFQEMGTDVVVFGPGFIDQAHQPDEFIDKKQLSSCVDLLRQVLLSSSARDGAG
ncbi:MAG: acetylornithine deacetylase [Alphaproteobacteria bacterium]|nr:acetylornithine deacetylase [Alphaproteobacteria bacterium]